MSQLKLLSIVLFTLVLAACGNDDLQVTAKFSNTQDITEGTKVYFGNKIVGRVKDVSKTEYGSVVELGLDTELAKQVNTRAAVVVNRLRQGAPLELHNPPGPVNESLQAGQRVEALDSMMQLVGWGVGSSLQAGTESISAFKDYLNSEQFERDKAEFGIAFDKGMKAAKEGVQEAGKSVQQAIDEINLSEEELASLVEELGTEMAPVVQEIAKGGTELMMELEQLVANLEQGSESEQQSGEQFLRSLTEALQTLNKSIEAGVEQGLVEQPSATEE